MRSSSVLVAFGVIAIALTSSAAARALPPVTSPPPPPATAPIAGGAPDAGADVARARKHYERGLELYNEENFPAALVEMERAYQIAPSYRIQYNLARIYRQLNSYAASIRNYEAYLRGGGENVPAERRAEVVKEISILRTRIATLEIRVNIPDADVAIDDVPIGKSPITTTTVVDPGRRKISATKAGYSPAAQVVSVAGTDAQVVSLSLVDLRRPAERPADTGPRNRALVAWGLTGAFAATATVFGVLALNENDKLKTERGEFGVDPAALAARASKVKSYSVLSDAFTVGSAVAGGFAVIFTVKALSRGGPDERERSAARLELAPTGAAVRGSF